MLVTRRQGIHSTCSSPYRPRSACSGRGLACTGSGFHPHAARPYHAVHQHERCESAGSRTDPSHCTPRRYVGVEKARDWPSPVRPRDHPAQQEPEPLISRPPPRNCLANLVPQPRADHGDRAPSRNRPQLTRPRSPRKRRPFFGLAPPCGPPVDTPPSTPSLPLPPSPHPVDNVETRPSTNQHAGRMATGA